MATIVHLKPEGGWLNQRLFEELTELLEKTEELATLRATIGGEKRNDAAIAVQKLHVDYCRLKENELRELTLKFLKLYSKPVSVYHAERKRKIKELEEEANV